MGEPFESSRVARGTSRVEPCAIHANGEDKEISKADDIPNSVACTDFGVLYDAGASKTLMLITAASSTVTRLEAWPLSSVSKVQLDAPPHAEKEAAGVEVKSTLAPLTAVVPSADNTWTRIGFGASPPTGVAGFDPSINLIMSSGPAPYVIASIMAEDAPVTGSFSVTVWCPSAFADATAIT